ncbi:hypothetical protein BE20_40745 [Sorangium cellulosum]|uniref:Uncharacterized protein n=1 Tax=Sorangium cellulosum TaxID=56 RepID=A0A150RN88_SORCE|nr:hypothetical protein BE18_35050 [Sorangium cellulosum]KYF96821.1 hypothetical protein BE20_40745 [Sorangium cellulosum]
MFITARERITARRGRLLDAGGRRGWALRGLTFGARRLRRGLLCRSAGVFGRTAGVRGKR